MASIWWPQYGRFQGSLNQESSFTYRQARSPQIMVIRVTTYMTACFSAADFLSRHRTFQSKAFTCNRCWTADRETALRLFQALKNVRSAEICGGSAMLHKRLVLNQDKPLKLEILFDGLAPNTIGLRRRTGLTSVTAARIGNLQGLDHDNPLGRAANRNV